MAAGAIYHGPKENNAQWSGIIRHQIFSPFREGKLLCEMFGMLFFLFGVVNIGCWYPLGSSGLNATILSHFSTFQLN